MAPPATARRDGRAFDLEGPAAAASDRHLAAFPDELDRYEPEVARAWCRHDLQHVLHWAIADVDRADEDLLAQVAWLVGVLHARDYPVERLDPAFRTLADVVEEQTGDDAVAARLREGAAHVLVTASRCA